MYSALLIARLIINYCNDNKMIISNLKLQKILYFVQADFLVNKESPCFFEDIEAWNFGPVVPEVYLEYKIYGSSNIPYRSSIAVTRDIQKDDRVRIIKMVQKCAKYSTSTLVEITHRQAPWREAYNPYRRNVIPKEEIRKYFIN